LTAKKEDLWISLVRVSRCRQSSVPAGLVLKRQEQSDKPPAIGNIAVMCTTSSIHYIIVDKE